MGALFQEVLFDATVTGNVTGQAFPTPDITMLDVVVVMTAGAATVTSVDVLLQGSCDDGANWADLVADHGVTDGGAAFTTPAIKIVDAKANATAENCRGIYKHLGVSKVRVKINGSFSGGGSLPVKVVASGK